jgi:hypothetical protein
MLPFEGAGTKDTNQLKTKETKKSRHRDDDDCVFVCGRWLGKRSPILVLTVLNTAYSPILFNLTMVLQPYIASIYCTSFITGRPVLRPI